MTELDLANREMDLWKAYGVVTIKEGSWMRTAEVRTARKVTRLVAQPGVWFADMNGYCQLGHRKCIEILW